MALNRLEITSVRNLKRVVLKELSTANLFYGANGSGKTSILESIHMLGMGRSFRSGQIKSVISHGTDSCTVFGQLADSQHRTLGVARDRQGGLEAKIAGERVQARSELAAAMPLQVIHADSFNLLAGSPTHRRQFMDWGVFHVEHVFFAAWQRLQKAIKQRNSLLRRGKISASELRPWDHEFCEAGEQVNRARQQYLAALAPVFLRAIARLAPGLSELQLVYRQGWDKSLALAEALLAVQETDRQHGFTHVGPQRADIRISCEGYKASEMLSRGQQKLVVCALKLAQGQLMREGGGASCLYLIDDLPAELDAEHCGLVAAALQDMEAQVFVTCVDEKEILSAWPLSSTADRAMFHVEHGVAGRIK